MFRNLMLFLSLSIFLIKSKRLMKVVKNTEDKDTVAALIAEEGRVWGQMLLNKAGGEVTVIGEEKLSSASTVCFISNHSSYFDIPLMLGFINKPKAFLAKVEILKVPILSEWMQLMKCVFIDRNNIRQSAKAIRQATINLTEGTSMVVFPEGTRAKDGVLGEFKAGGFKMAVSSGVPIVPITIDGAYQFFEGKRKAKGKVKVTMTIGDLVETKGLTKEEISQLPDKIKGIIASNLRSET